MGSRALNTSDSSPRPRPMIAERPISAVSRQLRTGGWVAEIFGADLRSLAALRVVLAVIVLANIVNRVRSLSALYTDEGVLPRKILLNELNPWQLSLNMINGTLFVQTLLFGIAALAALALLVGYRTRLMTVIVWVMVLSIQARNPFVLNAADTLLRLLLFWSIFLPLGACWSMDRLRQAAPPRLTTRFLSIATVGLFLQIVFMYWFTVILKSGQEWRVDGTALYYALSAEQLTTPIAAYLLHFPALLKVLTFIVLGIETIGPLLLFSPFFRAPVRTLGIVAIMSLHFGIMLMMVIGLFPWLSALCMVCFLPSWFWDTVVPKLRAAVAKHSRPARRLRQAVAVFAHPDLAPLRARVSSWGRVGQLASVGTAAGLSPNLIGNNNTSSGMPRPLRPATHDSIRSTLGRSSRATNLVALCCLGFVFSWNLMTVSSFSVPQQVRPVAYLLGLNQYWTMFAPYPTKSTKWYVIPGTLRDGQQVNLLAPTLYHDPLLIEEPSADKPVSVHQTFRDEGWRKYLEALADDGADERRLYFGKYVCRTWNALHHDSPLELQTFKILAYSEKTLPNGQRAAPSHEDLWDHRCS